MTQKHKQKMSVQTVIINTLYGGKQTLTLCESCSAHTQEVIDCNAQFCYFAECYKALGDWHEGICKEHSYHQNCLDRQFRHY